SILHLVVKGGYGTGVVAVKQSVVLIVIPPPQVAVLVDQEDVGSGQLLVQLQIGLQTAEKRFNGLRAAVNEFPLQRVGDLCQFLFQFLYLLLSAFRNCNEQLKIQKLVVVVVDLFPQVVRVSRIFKGLLSEESEDGDIIVQGNGISAGGPELLEVLNTGGKRGKFGKIMYPGGEKQISNYGKGKEHSYYENFLHDTIP